MNIRTALKLTRKGKKISRRANKKGAASIFLWSFILMLFFNIFFTDAEGAKGKKKKDEPFAKNEVTQCRLTKIIDGDTVDALCWGRNLRIRLVGIDAPETKQEPWGAKSTNKLRKFLPKKRDFLLVSQGPDVYRRQLGTIYKLNCSQQYDEKCNVNLQMIKTGYAVAYDGSDTPMSYRVAQEEARKKKIGIWSKPGLQQDPKKYRKQTR
ncbi:MAG: thermonuclease family protein [Cardiobacteriaceae bacterium]|nr:thermonuclease family protein [Cardiobacteriaceae bacterium]